MNIYWTAVGVGSLTFTFNTPNGPITKTICITILELPNANFTTFPFNQDTLNEPLVACAAQTLYFNNYSDGLGGEGPFDCLWDFGDHTPNSTTFNPYHIYESPGACRIKLTVTNSCGCKSTIVRPITIQLKGFDIITSSVACEGQVSTYNLPPEGKESCNNNFKWSVTGGRIIENMTQNGTLSVIWNQVDASGFGTVSFNPEACKVECPLITTIKVPVVQSNGSIKGNASICGGDFGTYTLPEWPTTDFIWEIVGNGTTNTIGEVLPTDQRNIVIIKPNPTFFGALVLRCKYTNTLLHCGGTANYSIMVRAKTTITGPTNVCQNTVSAFVSNFINPVNWQVKNSAGNIVFMQNNATSLNYNFPIAGNFQVEISGTTICPVTKPVTVLTTPQAPEIDQGIAYQFDTICPNTQYTYKVLNPVAGNQYLWEIEGGGSFLGSSTGEQVNVSFDGSNNQHRIKVVRQTVAPALCSSAATKKDINMVQIAATIKNLPFTNGVGFTSRACSSTSTPYQVGKLLAPTEDFPITGADSFLWSITPASAGSISSGSTSSTVVVNWNAVDAATTATLRVVMFKCTASLTLPIVVTIFPKPTITITGPASICSGTPVTFIAIGNPPLTSQNRITWDFGNGETYIGSTGNFSATTTFTNVGTTNLNFNVQATVNNANGCSGSSISPLKVINVLKGPAISFSVSSGSTTICPPNPINTLFTATGPTGTTYQWLKNGLNIVGQTGITLLVNNTTALGFGQYSLKGTLAGCTTTTSVQSVREFCNCPPLSCNVTPTPLLSILNTTANNCGTITLAATASGTPLSKGWLVKGPQEYSSGTLSPSGTPTFTPISPGVYDTFFYASYPCDNTSLTVRYEEYKKITIPYISRLKVDVSCGTTAATINVLLTSISPFYEGVPLASRRYRYLRSTNGGAYVALTGFITATTYTITAQPAGNYNYKLEIYGSLSTPTVPEPTCTSPVINLNIPALPLYTITNTPISCHNSVVTFSISPAISLTDTVEWEFGDNSRNTNPTIEKVYSFPEATIARVTLVIKNSFGCVKASLSKQVIVPKQCFKGFTFAQPDTVCEGETVTIKYQNTSNANNTEPADNCSGTSYDLINGFTTVATNTTGIFTVSTPGFYRINKSGPGATPGSICSYLSYAEGITAPVISPKFKTKPSLLLTGQGSISVGADAIVNVLAATSSALSYSVDGNAPLVLPAGSTTLSVSELSVGNHTITVTAISDNCIQSRSTVVSVLEAPTAVTIAPVVYQCAPAYLNFGAILTATAPTIGTFIWSNGMVGPTIQVTDGGPYQVTFTNAGGCSISAQTDVKKNPEQYLWVFPSGIYSACKTDDRKIIGPKAQFNDWAWIKNNIPTVLDTNVGAAVSYMDPYIATSTGTYNMTISNGGCPVTSLPMQLSIPQVNCRQCLVIPPVLAPVPNPITTTNTPYCSYTIVLKITNSQSLTLPVQLVVPLDNVVINPTSVVLANGVANYTFTVFPTNFTSGSIEFKVRGIGTDGADCLTTFSLLLPSCLQPSNRLISENNTLLDAYEKFDIAPNPAKNKTTLTYTTNIAPNFEIYDLLGHKLNEHQTSTKAGSWEISLEGMPAGMYIVVMKNNDQVLSQKKLLVE